ncbi:MAG: VPLPA-CTERM sorting domain-containing protein [Pseudomonadota bacterium]
MKTFAKLGLIGLTIAASSAHADVFLPDSGNGELTLFVRNDTTGAVYARGLQIRLDDILTQAQINAGYTGDTSLGIVQNLGYAINTVGPDANLTSFLNGSDSFSWTIMAGDSAGSNNADPARRYLTTTQVVWDESNPDTVTNNNLVSFSQLQAVQNLVNQNVAGDVAGDGGSTAVNGQWRQVGAVPGSISGNWFGAGPDTVNALGTAANLYVLTTAGGGNSGLARTYQGLDVILNANGTLAAVVPSVPLPAAAWMLMSGLVTLAGVGRRKSAAVAAA